MTWTLKVLTGQHAGAEVDIEKKHFIVSSLSNQADCVISDSGLKEYPIQITALESLLVIKFFGYTPWYINGQKSLKPLAKIHPYDVIQVGTIAFAIGKTERNWPALEVPSIQKFRIPWSGLFVSGFLCIGSLNASFYFSENPPPPPAPSLTHLIATTLVAEEERERIVISGYLPNLPALLSTKQRVVEVTDIPTVWRVYRQDSLEDSVYTWLSEHKLIGYQVRVDGKGTALIKGVIPDQLITQHLVEAIKSEVTGIKDVRFDTKTTSEVREWLRQALIQGQLTSIGIANHQQQIVLTGQASQQQKQYIIALIHQAANLFGNQVPIRYQAYLYPDGVIPDIKAVITSKTPYIELNNGKKYLKNAVIGDGFTLRAITKNGIAISKNNQTIWITSGT